VKLFKDGNSEISKFDFHVDAGKAVKGSFTLLMEDGSDPDEVIIYPALLVGVVGKDTNQAFTCMDAGVTL